jgi:hypothetical protein
MRTKLGIVVSTLAFLLVAAPAGVAAVRYAEPNRNGPASTCPRTDAGGVKAKKKLKVKLVG